MIGVLLLHVIGFILVFVHVEGYTDVSKMTLLADYAYSNVFLAKIIFTGSYLNSKFSLYAWWAPSFILLYDGRNLYFFCMTADICIFMYCFLITLIILH